MPGLHVVAGLAGDLPLFRIFHHIIISVMTTSKNGITFYLTHTVVHSRKEKRQQLCGFVWTDEFIENLLIYKFE